LEYYIHLYYVHYFKIIRFPVNFIFAESKSKTAAKLERYVMEDGKGGNANEKR